MKSDAQRVLCRFEPSTAVWYGAPALEFAIDGDRVTLSDTVQEQSGAETRHTHTLHVGGLPQQVEHGYVMAAAWQGDRVITMSVARDGAHVMHVSYAVSGDGRTLTLTAAAAAHAGYPAVEQTIRFNRAADPNARPCRADPGHGVVLSSQSTPQTAPDSVRSSCWCATRSPAELPAVGKILPGLARVPHARCGGDHGGARIIIERRESRHDQFTRRPAAGGYTSCIHPGWTTDPVARHESATRRWRHR